MSLVFWVHLGVRGCQQALPKDIHLWLQLASLCLTQCGSYCASHPFVLTSITQISLTRKVYAQHKSQDFKIKNSRFPSMSRSPKGSVLTWAACRVKCPHRNLGASACPPQPTPAPSGSSSLILSFSTPLGMPHPNPFFFPLLPFSFLFSKKENIISFLVFIFLALLCPPCPPPSPFILCPPQSLKSLCP